VNVRERFGGPSAHGPPGGAEMRPATPRGRGDTRVAAVDGEEDLPTFLPGFIINGPPERTFRPHRPRGRPRGGARARRNPQAQDRPRGAGIAFCVCL
jgi:hypothetical protein